MKLDQKFKLGKHQIRFGVMRGVGGYILQSWIGYEDKWSDAPGYHLPLQPNLRKCKRFRNQVLKGLQRSRIY